ncbi:MAG: PilZ domain-containing protein [Gallionella sp.]
MSEFDEVEYERSHPRETVRTKAEVLVDGVKHSCMLTNISPAGTRLYTRLSVSRDQVLTIKIGEFGEYGEHKATVAWCYADEIGLEFEDDLTALSQELIKLI